MIDQSDTSSVPNFYAIGSGDLLGESFTPTLNSINFAEFYVNHDTNAFGVTVEVFSGGGFAGTLLGTSNSVSLPRDNNNGANGYTVDFTFSTPIALTPGQTYTLAIADSHSGDYIEVGSTGSNTYAGGS